MDVSIIIVNWNTKGLLQDCLKSIYERTGDLDYEVIVIDNASKDGSAKMVKSEFPQVILMENPDNRGFAAANNQGMTIAKGRYMLLLNSDTVILDNSITNTIYFADSNPKAGVIGCRVLNPDRTLQPTCYMFPSILNMLLSSIYLYKIFPNSKFFGRERMSWWDRNDVREVDVVTGCFMLVRREAIDQVGLMDERFFMYSEETDWCYRFKQKGWRVVFTPVPEIIHYSGASTKQRRTEMILQLWGSILQFLKKHKNPLTYSGACFFVAMFLFLRVPYWLCRAICSPNGRVEHFKTARTYIFGACKAITGGQGMLVER